MNRDEIWSEFLDTLPFEPYPFQEEALLAWFEEPGGVLVSAPTGMGKTLIAEAAIFEALKSGQRLYYTTPLIALTDQKFREFREKAENWGFSKDDVGLITGNRRVNADAKVLVVVAEILLNHLLGEDERLDEVASVVMDEFHNFNDFERGVVWELSLVMLPARIRLMLLSATVGNRVEFLRWLREEHGRHVRLVHTDERRVPLEFNWIGDHLLTEQLPEMVQADDATNRTPALVFCFNRDECWDVADRIKGLKLIDETTRKEIDETLDPEDFKVGIGPRLRQMLIRGVGVHHAGILPRYKEIVEHLFGRKLIPFVICTETLAAGINLPARSVVITTLLKGKPRERKLIPSSAAHQMFGRAGRPQFDDHGYVFALAHEDDVRIHKWRVKYDQIDPKSKDPGIMRARKQLEKKKPSRRSNEQYWTEGQFESLIKAGPAKLASRSMIPYSVLVYLLTKHGSVVPVREFLSKRFNLPDRLEKFQAQLDAMLENLATFGYLQKAEDEEHITLTESTEELLVFRSVDPLYGAFLARTLTRATLEEKLQALESVLPLPPAVARKVRRDDLPADPFEMNELDPQLVEYGLISADAMGQQRGPDVQEPEAPRRRRHDMSLAEQFEDEEEPLPLFPDKLNLLFEAKLAVPEGLLIQPKWVVGGIEEFNGEFFKFVGARELVKNEGLVLRHLLRLVILAGEFHTRTEDPHYDEIGQRATAICQSVDSRYTDRFLAEEQARAAAAKERM
jgi:superfamily II DNA/RNA helicase